MDRKKSFRLSQRSERHAQDRIVWNEYANQDGIVERQQKEVCNLLITVQWGINSITCLIINLI